MIITVIYYTPTVGPANASFSFSIYIKDKNVWGTDEQRGVVPLVTTSGTIFPGVNTFDVSVPIINLSELYISGSGSIQNDTPPPSIFVAERPSGHVSDGEAFGVWGPPWISLAQLSSGIGVSADLFIINGKDNQIGSAHPWVVGAWAVNLSHQEAKPEINNIIVSH
ncbi:MAG: hypothetical protein PHI97_35040 [Desulfobulbus sp.]|nr:hypothetical protein [Desulfobulbus sp.]